MLRMHRRSESLLCYIIDIRSLPKGRSLFIHLINSLLHYQICDSEFIPRSVDGLQPTTPALPFVRSMGPKTRNVYSPSARKYAKTSYFGPTDIACLPGPIFVEILEISSFIKKINIYFLFYKIFY